MRIANKPASTVINVQPATHTKLQDIAQSQHRSMEDVVADLVDRYERELFWARAKEAVERLRADPAAWADYQREIAFFSGGSMDGLEQEEPYFTPEEEAAIRAEYARSQSR